MFIFQQIIQANIPMICFLLNNCILFRYSNNQGVTQSLFL